MQHWPAARLANMRLQKQHRLTIESLIYAEYFEGYQVW